MPEVQVDTAQNAIALALKNGTTDFAQEIGPDWRNHFDSLSEQINYARGKGIPLSVMEMKSGGSSNDTGNTQESEQQREGKSK